VFVCVCVRDRKLCVSSVSLTDLYPALTIK